MAIEQCNDDESVQQNGLEDLESPLMKKSFNYKYDDEFVGSDTDDGSITMVLLSTCVAVCGSFIFGTCVGYSAPTQSAIREDLNLSIAQYSTFGSILTIGAMVGAITSGRISDFIGRKWAMRMSACSCIMGWLAIYFAKGTMTLDIGRLFSGYGIGVLSYVVPIFIAEIAPKELRGGFTTLNQLMIVTGSSVSFLIGSIITWRALALMGLVPCIALLSGLFFVPESPRWLAKAGRQKEFNVALRMLRGQNADISREAAEIEDCLMLHETLPKGSFIDLFQSKYIRSVIIGVGLMVFQQSVGINGIGFYVSQTFVKAGLSSGKLGTIAYGIVQVPITLVGAILMDRSGRKPLVTISAMGTFLGCFFIATGFLLKSYGLLLEWIPLFVVGGVLTYISAFSIGFGGVPWVIMSEIFPLNVKGAAGSLVVLINWSGAWLVSYTYNFMMKWSASGTYYIYAGFCILTVLFVANFVPETKGKTLEEIQESINSKTETLE
ncbi:sugar transporter ERD6-like 16 [Chenopodium quinoa]|uniref:Major facilitator superfamily (MFS) profile domain-containing protein n=1 Tax=Chenopodium quinoa TaxID=63459 RepID=A0A803LSA3_CHEQI|nr:sugar transporter ERD6-like 16 [Chenopodium quinoa]